MATRVSPELLDQLERAGTSPVQAVVQLRDAHEPHAVPSPEDSTRLADDVLRRVTAEVGHPAARTNVLRNLATLVVEADPDFLRSLIRQPEVISALPNQTAESPFIPPRTKRPR
jgi:hypothetical protein